MSFLTPLFLAGLAALAIPVLLHLIQKERRNVVQFPSLMFLRRIPYQSVQRRRIRHWLLLAMRLAALALIVFAFARPFVRRADPPGTGATGAREVVVLLDRSYSMEYGDRWQRALGAARNVVNGLSSSDRASIVLFSSGAEVALRSTSDKGRLAAAFESVKPGAGATRYGPALKLAGSILGESALPRREAVLISDFQRSGWQGAEGVRLPDGATVTPVPLGERSAPNLAVTPVSLQRSLFSGQERVTVTGGVVNHGDTPAATDLSLEVGGRVIQTRRVSVGPNGSGSATFEPVTLAEAGTKASIRIGGDALDRDNVFNFVLSPEPPIGVIVADRPGGGRDASLYLTRALSVSESPRFEIAVRQADALTADDLNAATVVLLNDTPVPPAIAERLGRFVERGGGLLVVAGERTAWPGGPDLLPASLGAPVDRATGTPARLGALEYGHPVFEIFRAPRSGDFAAAHFYGYRASTVAPGSQVVARFDDGGAALLERNMGSGRVLLWTSTLDLYWNDFALKPVFLPFVHRVVRHLSHYREPVPWRTVGDVLEPPSTPGARVTSRVALTPSGERLPIDGEGPDVIELTEQGFYEIRAQGRDTDTPAVVASNVDLGESDMTGIDPQEVAAAATGRAGGTTAAGTETMVTDQARESAQRLWWYLLFAGLILLGAETVLGNRSTV